MIRNNPETGSEKKVGNKIPLRYILSGMVEYVGTKHSTLSYDSNLNQWNMSVANNPKILGVSPSTMKSLLIGVHEWEIFGDIECDSRAYKVKLALRKDFMSS